MKVEEAITQRHSTRAFTDQKISEDKIRKIISLAQLAPSWVNSQPAHVYAATGTTLELIRQRQANAVRTGAASKTEVPTVSRSSFPKEKQDNMAKWYASIPDAIGSEWQKYNNDAALKLYNAQLILYLTLPKNHAEWSMFDLGLFADNILLAAKEQGLDSMTAYYLVMYPQILRETLPISKNERIIVGIALGYKQDDATINGITSEREPVDDVLTVVK
ncbi:nitroreductase [Secundilactobacillus paracollinoides]|uniref:nitroreductase n=1 Tax=Secundilactobacillus paracollinoides TaxID=240427 RepID=UPI0006F0307B|nr:nitroreductase [Secundilactobacillus paracollinoides]KRL79291.1 p-nitrobenzoate reductase [Secundilactobacillus paracollinoides DSM 15502 = JCM 11969]